MRDEGQIELVIPTPAMKRDVVLLGYLVYGADALERLQGDTGFEFGRKVSSLSFF
jgi:hypothetical protein